MSRFCASIAAAAQQQLPGVPSVKQASASGCDARALTLQPDECRRALHARLRESLPGGSCHAAADDVAPLAKVETDPAQPCTASKDAAAVGNAPAWSVPDARMQQAELLDALAGHLNSSCGRCGCCDVVWFTRMCAALHLPFSSQLLLRCSTCTSPECRRLRIPRCGGLHQTGRGSSSRWWAVCLCCILSAQHLPSNRLLHVCGPCGACWHHLLCTLLHSPFKSHLRHLFPASGKFSWTCRRCSMGRMLRRRQAARRRAARRSAAAATSRASGLWRLLRRQS